MPKNYQRDAELKCRLAKGPPSSATPFSEHKEKLKAAASLQNMTEVNNSVDFSLIRSTSMTPSIISTMQNLASIVGAEIPPAENGGREISQILWRATRNFAASLINECVEHSNAHFTVTPIGKKRSVIDMKVLVPRHVHETVASNEEYSWLTNEGLGTEAQVFSM